MGATVKAAAASYAEVEKALKEFLSRHPESAKDTAVSRGAAGDEILAGAIATVTFEGDGSLFDVMNYGTGDAARDAATVKDLTDTLSALGCYYEQGHDWSLGVYPKEESGEDRRSRGNVDALAKALGVEPDDLEAGPVEQTDGGPVSTYTSGGRTFLVGDDGALHAMAVDRLKDEYSDGENLPEGFMGWLDPQAVQEAAMAAAEGMAEDDADELGLDAKREWLEVSGLLPAPSNAGEGVTNDQVEDAFSTHWSEWTEERAKASIGSDPTAYLEDMSGGPEEFKKYALENGLLDVDRMADDIASNDGADNVLGGELHEEGGFSWLES